MPHAARQIPSWLIFDVGQKESVRTLTLILFCIATAFAAPSASVVDEVSALLARLPPQRVLREARDIVVYAASDMHEPKHKTPDELERAKQEVKKAKEIIPKLRKLVRPGSSVFDYPGLLARGEIRWNDLTKDYEMYIGVYLRDVEGQRPYDMRIRFDAKGVILKLEDVIWKS